MTESFAALCAGLIAGWALTLLSIRLALRLDVRDRPGHRSSHSVPTPRLGGLGIALPMQLLYIVLFVFWSPRLSLAAQTCLSAAVMGGFLSFFLGLADDLKGMGAVMKLAGQAFCALTAVLAGLRIHSLGMGGGFALTPLLGGAAAFCWIMLLMNALNFMDGMNGKLGTFAAVVALGLGFMGRGIIPPGMVMIFPALTGVCLGFLVFNLTPAQTFMGDSGSQYLGYLAGIMTLYLHNEAPASQPFWGFVILLLPFLFDVIFTLVRRILHGENILRAHRSHLYQRLLIAGWSHPQVLRLTFATYAICCGLAAGFQRIGSTSVKAALGVCAMGVMAGYAWFVRRVEKRSAEQVNR
ncbi:MAG TPA: glycosyltransferase family 4 protein [Candidatus Sumerlaeota bacterium]|nr:glycosyltransferase family 4 protein [Candidatus Sumerlaeota bacterium]